MVKRTIILTAAIVVGVATTIIVLSLNQAETRPDRVLKVTASTSKTVYDYGEPILLNITLYNSGIQTIDLSSSDLKPYAGLPHACGSVSYFDFVMLNGSYSANDIRTYDDLRNLKQNALYVYDPPSSRVSCVYPVANSIENVAIKPSSSIGTITYGYSSRNGNSTNHTFSVSGHSLSAQYEIRYKYEATSPVSNATKLAATSFYDKSIPLPVGKYTIVVFAMSGQIGKPIGLEVR